MKRVLILFAHPAFHNSVAQKALIAAASTVSGVTVRDLYETYPDSVIDAGAEQELLLANDIIILQHPFYWYSSPAILKEWQDIVLEYGFAYGDGGTALSGKWMTNVLSTGGPVESYTRSGYNRFSIREFLAPFEQTATLCGMHYLAPFVVPGMAARGASARARIASVRYAEYLAALGRGDARTSEVDGFPPENGLIVIDDSDTAT
jgi:glutathione-regulated potassium-efflux system ancillary protein KefG